MHKIVELVFKVLELSRTSVTMLVLRSTHLGCLCIVCEVVYGMLFDSGRRYSAERFTASQW